MLKLLIILCLFISGCQSIDLKTNHTYVILPLNSVIQYENYINNQNALHNTIDTSKVGKQTITYTYQKQSASLNIQIAHFYDVIYNPEDVIPYIEDHPENIDVLINKMHEIKNGWIPNDLISVVDDSSIYLRQEAANAYKDFYTTAQKKGISIYSISGYRTYATQNLYYTHSKSVLGIEHTAKYSAFPNRSEHQLGLAIDISYKKTGDRLTDEVANQPIGKFILSDAYKYGFILRYPHDKIKITNYGYEPWHIRYVGKELAKELFEKGLTLEEYYGEE